MKILIGTPIHEIKDYAMERWLANVAKLQKESLADLLLVDNSPGLDYVETVRGYCAKYGIKNYKIEHIEVWQPNGEDERIGRAREAIRQYILARDYDAWFTWESDQLMPANALDKLISIMEKGNFMVVSHNAWSREIPPNHKAGFGCSLVKRECLEKYGFLLEYPDMRPCWHGGDVWFKRQVLAGGGNYIEVFGIINPIYHLNK